MSQRFATDVLVIGAGAAGLTAALNLADDHRVTVLSKGDFSTGSTPWAQGGIAAVTDPADSESAHVQDTLIAGAGLCDEAAVSHTVRNARAAIDQIIDWGVEFDRDGEDDGYHLTQEGGHSFRRILHVADATGAALAKTLAERALDHPRIDVLERRMAIDVISTPAAGDSRSLSTSRRRRCLGAYVYNADQGRVEVFQANAVILATGGASKVYLYTSNPDGATGDGIAMAWRAGARVANMEFNQFHPTCLFHPHAKSFLISEALRGEGAVLKLASGELFMKRFDDRGELAPRDIVARAIDHEMKRLGDDCVYLDISHRPAEFIKSHFPTIAGQCLQFGIDITKEPIPVVPAAHYSCGGVVVDDNGATDVEGLYAIGESSCTGLHGANRLASNSLLECLVYARSAAAHIRGLPPANQANTLIPHWDESQVTDSDEDVVLSHNWEELRRFMWDYVGIVRTDKRLERAARRVELLKQEIHEYYSNYRVGNDLIELRNLVQVAALIVRSAQLRQESRGLHFNLDHPELSETATATILHPSQHDPLNVPQNG
ncbi:MAG: L-aspartate oxidase [Pseudomonadaceae bacterium]|nr:L-aspartate oxidase [Pseudomonadaceae bacterium]